jgi:hypothetical protein
MSFFHLSGVEYCGFLMGAGLWLKLGVHGGYIEGTCFYVFVRMYVLQIVEGVLCFLQQTVRLV